MPSNIDRQTLLDRVAESYPVIAHDLLRPLLDLFSVSRELCGGDMDKFLVMLVVANRTTEHKLFASYSQSQLLSGEVPIFPGLGTNVRSISESIGAPRETVRRKVGELIKAGWIARRGTDLFFTATAYQALAPARVAIEQLAVRNYEVVVGLLRSVEDTGSPRRRRPS